MRYSTVEILLPTKSNGYVRFSEQTELGSTHSLDIISVL